LKKILVTGGAGFIGSNFIRHMLKEHKDYKIINLDKLTYAGNLDNLRDVENKPNYDFIRGDICDVDLVNDIVKENVDTIINFAAETHVDRSIEDPSEFMRTDFQGVYVLLEAARKYNISKFIQISTDEVYGTAYEGFFKEEDRLKPRNPYSVGKLAGERLAYSYFATHKVPVIITRASNNFGPYQYPEKFIPLFVTNALEGKPLPLYGDGSQIRDWIYVIDHCKAIDVLLERGKVGEVYNIATGNLIPNIEIAKRIVKILKVPESMIRTVIDRPGHDIRYALDFNKIQKLGWKPSEDFENNFKKTVMWYVENKWWWEKIKNSEKYKRYYEKQYHEII
jgi:dTDP-glucose 4,6-dehydratase